MPSINELVAEFNALVPQALERGISVKHRNSPYKSLAVGQRRLAWLRSQLLTGSATPAQIDAAIETQTFGCEFECIMPRGMSHYALADAIRVATGFPCAFLGYTHNSTSEWKVVTDASLGRSTGAEIVSPILTGANGFEQVKKVCDAAKAAGCKISKRCGFHVHVGARNEGLEFFKQLAKLYRKYEPVIDGLVAPSRRASSNQYCGPMRWQDTRFETANTVNQLLYVIDGGKFVKLNYHAWARQGTVEYRQHQGTLDAHKAIQWVKFCLRMTATAKMMSGPDDAPVALGVLLEKLMMKPDEKAYFESRQQAFANARVETVARRSFN